jgi:hypothetical protein
MSEEERNKASDLLHSLAEELCFLSEEEDEYWEKVEEIWDFVKLLENRR